MTGILHKSTEYKAYLMGIFFLRIRLYIIRLTRKEELEKYNACHTNENLLSAAKGFARYEPEKYKNYRTLFIDAEARCMKDKAEYHEKLREDKRYS